MQVEEQEPEGRGEIQCTSASFESALTSAFNRTDEEFGKADNAALVGTTAVVALVGSRQLYVANCGTHCSPCKYSRITNVAGVVAVISNVLREEICLIP